MITVEVHKRGSRVARSSFHVPRAELQKPPRFYAGDSVLIHHRRNHGKSNIHDAAVEN